MIVGLLKIKIPKIIRNELSLERNELKPVLKIHLLKLQKLINPKKLSLPDQVQISWDLEILFGHFVFGKVVLKDHPVAQIGPVSYRQLMMLIESRFVQRNFLTNIH